jgi:hypothetical protein
VQSEKMGSPAASLSLTIPVTPVFWRDMTSNWRKHLIICLFLGLLAVPIYFLDVASTQQGGGNWITLDFRGLIFWTYITLLAIHVTLSSIAALSFPNSGALRIHLCSMVLSVILLIAGFVFYGKLLRAQAVSSRPTNFDGETRRRIQQDTRTLT